MRYLPMRLRIPGVCAVCSQPVIFDGKRWTDRPRVAHVCPLERAVCGALMPGSGRAPERRMLLATERCARTAGHKGNHHSRYAMDNELYAQTGHRRRIKAA